MARHTEVRLGHSDIQTTLNTYGHLFEGLDEAAAERLDDIYSRTPADYPRTAAFSRGVTAVS